MDLLRETFCGIMNRVLQAGKRNIERGEKPRKMTKNVIFERFLPLSKFHFPACSTLIMLTEKRDDKLLEPLSGLLT